MVYKHIPVMMKEAIDYLQPRNGGFFVDCTLGGGGYSLSLSKVVGKDGLVISIDADDLALDNAEKIFSGINNVRLVKGNFRDLAELLPPVLLGRKIDGMVMDLGLSSAQLDDDSRGFSFKNSGPLNMSFGSVTKGGDDAYQIVNFYDERELSRIFRVYGEEDKAYKIAKAIVNHRKDCPIKTSGELAELIASVLPRNFKKNAIHPATKTFQALRMAVNGELDNLSKALQDSLTFLKPGGRLVVVSYHSLEDRMVKNFFRENSRDCICHPSLPICNCGHIASLKVVTKKPVYPSDEEMSDNPRSRSAKLRVAERVN